MSQDPNTNVNADNSGEPQQTADVIELAAAVAPATADDVPEAETIPPLPSRQPLPVSDELRRAAEDVRILYSYVSREDRFKADELHEKPMSAYSEIPDRILDDKVSPSYDERAKLWKMLSELSNIAFPATADSIRNSYYGQMMKGSERRIDSRRPVRLIWHLGAIGFFLTLLLGLYVSFTESVMTDTSNRIDEYYRIQTGSFDTTRLEKLLAATNPPVNLNPTLTPNPTPGTPTQPATEPATIGQPPGDAASSEAALLADAGKINMLRGIALEEIASEINYGFKVLEFTTFYLVDQENGEFSLFARTPLQMQGYINKLVSAFILPAIASLLGAVVFILRDSERRMESVAMSPLRSQTYLPRIILAVIAGTVIGWLTGQDTTGVFGKISPAAASFVVGYSTEILIRLLDSFKQALGVTDPDREARDRVARPN